MKKGQDEKEGKCENNYSHWVYSTFNIPRILLKGFIDLSNIIVLSCHMPACSLAAMLATYSPRHPSSRPFSFATHCD